MILKDSTPLKETSKLRVKFGDSNFLITSTNRFPYRRVPASGVFTPDSSKDLVFRQSFEDK